MRTDRMMLLLGMAWLALTAVNLLWDPVNGRDVSIGDSQMPLLGLSVGMTVGSFVGATVLFILSVSEDGGLEGRRKGLQRRFFK